MTQAFNKSFTGPIVIFDGYCNLCSRMVGLILRHEKEEYYSFLSLESALKMGFPLSREEKVIPDSIIVYEQGNYYYHSSAVLKIAARLKFPFNLAVVFRILPSFLRDPFYRLIAINRYRWFGKRKSCYIPMPGWERRFLS